MSWVTSGEIGIAKNNFKGGIQSNMKKLSIFAFLIILVLILAACTIGSPSSVAAHSSLPPVTPTIEPKISPSPSPQPQATPTINQASACSLLDSYDLANLFSYAEVEQPILQYSQATHPVFTDAYAPASEIECTFRAFSHPGSKDYQFLQIDYWIDLPVTETPIDWTLLGSQDRPQGAQIITGLGDDAFFSNGQLTFEKDMAYVTLAISSVNLLIDPGPNQALEIETQIARDMLNHLQ